MTGAIYQIGYEETFTFSRHHRKWNWNSFLDFHTFKVISICGMADFWIEIHSTVWDESQSFKESLNRGFRHCASGTHLRQVGTEDESCSQSKGGFFADQFENLANFRAHYEGTAPEIWAQTGGKVNAFVAAAGTGGTIAGVSCYLKVTSPNEIRTISLLWTVYMHPSLLSYMWVD